MVAAAITRRTITANATYSGKEVLALLATARGVGSQHATMQSDSEKSWQQVKLMSLIRKVKIVFKCPSGQGKFSPVRRPTPGSPDVYWVCRKKGHFKDECPFVRCRFCKVLGHRVGESPIAPARREALHVYKPKVHRQQRISEPE